MTSGDYDVRWFENFHITFHIARLLGETLDRVQTREYARRGSW
jgi:hypothetical protein